MYRLVLISLASSLTFAGASRATPVWTDSADSSGWERMVRLDPIPVIDFDGFKDIREISSLDADFVGDEHSKARTENGERGREDPATVPESPTAILCGGALLALGIVGRRRLSRVSN